MLRDPDPDPLDPQDFGFLDQDPQKYADPRIQIQGAKYQPKTLKTLHLPPPLPQRLSSSKSIKL